MAECITIEKLQRKHLELSIVNFDQEIICEVGNSKDGIQLKQRLSRGTLMWEPLLYVVFEENSSITCPYLISQFVGFLSKNNSTTKSCCVASEVLWWEDSSIRIPSAFSVS